MTGTFMLAWLAFPALALLLCTGAGLLVRRAAGAEVVAGILVVPVGLATLVVLGGFLCYFAAIAPLAGPAFAVVGAAGLLLERRTIVAALRRRPSTAVLWPALAGFGAWMVLAAPVLLSGKPGFSGYAHIVDISYEFDLAAHLPHSGRSIPHEQLSAYQVVLNKYLGSGYPGGGPWTLGALSNLMPLDLSWLYQPFLALLSGSMGLSLYALLGRVLPARPLRALAAFIAAQPNVLIAYALAGGIKELATASFLTLTAAVLLSSERWLRPSRALLVAPIAISATVASLSLVSLPWVATLAVGTCLTVSVLRGRRVNVLQALAGSGLMAGATVVLSLPTLAAALKLLPAVKGSGPVDLGNLAAPVPRITAAGVWITGDIRYPQYAHAGPSEAVAVLVLVLAAAGIVYAAVRRSWSLAWLGIAGAVAVAYIARRYGPWIQFKSYCVTAPVALALAFAGVGGLIAAARRVAVRAGALAVHAGRGSLALGAVPAAVLAAAVLIGNALLYHDTTLAPYARLHDLQRIGERFAGEGPTFNPDFEEYAEYYLRDDNETSPVNGPGLGLRPDVNRAAEPGGIYQYDLDEFSTQWLETFRTLVVRRGPYGSRPPANYRLAYLSPYYEVWQRDAAPSQVYLHIPLRDRAGDLRGATCSRVLAAARAAGAGARIALMPAPRGFVQLDGSNMTLSGALTDSGGTILGVGAGRARREQPIPVAGRYDFYLGGSVGRPVDVSIDGRKVGTAAYQVSYPQQWVLIASRWVSKGVHRIEISRGGVSLHAGNGDGVDLFNRTIGPLVLTPASPPVPQVRYVATAAFARYCRSSAAARWVEVVRGGAA